MLKLPFFREKQIKSGVIYDAIWGQTSGEFIIVSEQQLSLAVPYRGQLDAGIKRTYEAWDELVDSNVGLGVVRGVGAGLVVVSLSGAFLTVKPILSSELSYRAGQVSTVFQHQVLGREDEQLKLQQEAAADREAAQAFAQEAGITNTDFSIYIPKIDAKAPVFANTDPANQEVYAQALKAGVAHAYGTSLPGQKGASFIFAHSTNGAWNVSRYNAVFYLLRELSVEDRDEIYVFFQGKLHKYRVAEKHITEANDVSWITDAKDGPERLVLQTCWPPGTAWKRLIIVAYPDPEPASVVSATIPYGGQELSQ